MRSVLACCVAAVIAAAGDSSAWAQRFGGRVDQPQARISVDSREIYAGLQFDLLISAVGFDEQPQPEVSAFQIAGCTVTFKDVTPNVATSISIINGQRSESRRVEYVYRYSVVAPVAGQYSVPAVTITQGSKSAATRAATFKAIELPTSRDMQVRLTLPDRPVSVGETFDVTIDWYLRRDPENPRFVVPLFDARDWVEVHPPAGAPAQRSIGRRRRALAFSAGDQDIELPYTTEKAQLEGVEYTRFRFKAVVTPIKSGTLELAPVGVVAQLTVGTRRDSFGFRVPNRKLFKAEDTPRSLQIRPLPLQGRPPSFAGAVGTGFSIQVRASRTVVKLGEPIELELLIRGDGRLEGLGLPGLDNPEGLPAPQFAIADAPVTGELVRDNDSGDVKGKRFRVTVRINSPEVREIPRLAFSYYNPTSGAYDTVYSEPIALSVAGSAVVGPGDVVSGSKNPSEQPGRPEPRSPANQNATGAIGADLSLSHSDDTLSMAWSVTELWPLLFALYALPLFLLILQVWRVRTREERGKSSETKSAMRVVDRALERASSEPANESAPALLAALRKLAACTQRDSIRGEQVIARIETVSYDPKAADQPLDREILAQAKKLAHSWVERDGDKSAEEAGEKGRDDVSPRRNKSSKTAILMLVAAAASMLATPADAGQPDVAVADRAMGAGAPKAAGNTAPAATIDAARRAYRAALAEVDRDARASRFARAERIFRGVVQAHPDRPELLTDWGNAAVGAQDMGRATLAYRRALSLEPGLTRAESNLSWVRSRLPSWLPRPQTERAGGSLLFWRHYLSVPERHLIGGAGFAVAVLLLVPWARQRTWLRWLAVLPVVVWIGMIASIVDEERPVNDAVVVTDGVFLLSADSAGAPPALSNPLPAGAEVIIAETREQWTRVALSDGVKTGWLPLSAVARVIPERQ
ncbi:MAG: BatD family protein [Proteobacteria bacterium]|nr:BatD family protein [Pseudomonadota bacterium]